MDSPLEMALTYHRHGLTPVPFEAGSKGQPVWGGWKEYQGIPQTEGEVKTLFNGLERVNIALVGGVPGPLGHPFFVDCDSGEKAGNFSRYLAGLGIDTWEAQRNRFAADDPHAGGQHFYFMTDQPVKTRKIDAFGEVRGRGAIVIAPHSTHPSGATYQFKRQPPVIYRLDSLQTLPALNLEAAPTEAYTRLPRLAQKLLAGEPAAVNKYPSRSEAEAALCASLIRAGLGFDEILTVMLTHPGPGKFSELHRKKQQQAINYLQRTYDNAFHYVQTHPSEAVTLAQQLKAWALSQPWPGQGGASDKAIFLAHLSIMERCGKSVYGASCRELAELAGVSWQTANNANHRLVKAGLLFLAIPSTVTHSHVWTVADENVSNLDTLSLGCDGVSKYETNLNAHDAFRWAGLNKTGSDIYQSLLRLDAVTPQELAKVTQRSRATIYRKLELMEKLNMAEQVGRGRWRGLEVNLEAVATMLNTAGKGEAERKKHVQERRHHRLVLKRGSDESGSD